MKIIHVTDELMPSAGGLVSVPINLAAAQVALGHEVHLLGRTGKKKLLDSAETEKIPDFEKVTLEEADQPGLAGKLLPTKATGFFKKHISPNSIVHLHGVWDPFLLQASKQARKVGAPYIVTPHSMLHPWQMERFVWPKKIVFAIGWRRMFDKAAFIHTLTEAEKEFVENYQFNAPIEIIPNGVYPETFSPIQPNPFLNKYQHLKQKPYILFLSRLSRQKGIPHLLEGFDLLAERNPDVQLVLAGPDYGELENIKNQLSTMRHADRVLLPGPIYGDDKLGALHGASCFALTSLNEGFSVAILEALACGLPVVISKNCYFPNVAKFNAGLIPSHDAQQISSALSSLIDHPQERKRMGDNARELVAEHYSWHRIAKYLIRTYKKNRS